MHHARIAELFYDQFYLTGVADGDCRLSKGILLIDARRRVCNNCGVFVKRGNAGGGDDGGKFVVITTLSYGSD